MNTIGSEHLADVRKNIIEKAETISELGFIFNEIDPDEINAFKLKMLALKNGYRIESGLKYSKRDKIIAYANIIFVGDEKPLAYVEEHNEVDVIFKAFDEFYNIFKSF